MYFSESCGRREGLYHSQEMGHADLEPYFDLSGEITSQYIHIVFAILCYAISYHIKIIFDLFGEIILYLQQMVCMAFMNLPMSMSKHTNKRIELG